MKLATYEVTMAPKRDNLLDPESLQNRTIIVVVPKQTEGTLHSGDYAKAAAEMALPDHTVQKIHFKRAGAPWGEDNV